MGGIVNLIRSVFSNDKPVKETYPQTDVGEIIEEIRMVEENQKIETGRRIHETTFAGLLLRLDIDITKTYRITVSHGQDRIYSFSVYADHKDYTSLRDAYQRILEFLKSDQKVKNLPDDDLLKGRFFGFP